MKGDDDKKDDDDDDDEEGVMMLMRVMVIRMINSMIMITMKSDFDNVNNEGVEKEGIAVIVIATVKVLIKIKYYVK